MFWCLLALAAVLAWDLVSPLEVLAQAGGDAGNGGGNTGGNPGWWNGNDPGEFAGGVIRRAYCDLVEHVEGNFGALLMTSAGVMAICTAALGDLRHTKSALVVAIGAFTISGGISLYFGQLCGGGGGTARTVENGALNRGINNAALAIAAGQEADFTQADSHSSPEGEDLEENDDPFEGF